MIKILLIEDDAAKSEKVKQELLGFTSGVENQPEIFWVRSCIDAKRELSRESYDLCVLDLNLPLREGDAPKENAGSDLLREIHEMDHVYHVPRHVVGLTSYDSEFEHAKTVFTNYMFSLLHYDDTKSEWKDRLKFLLKRVFADSDKVEVAAHANTVCVVTAVAELELAAMLDIPWKWNELKIPNDGTFYYEAYVDGRDGMSWRVVTAAADHAGMPSSIPLAMKMISHFTPKYLAMTGITGGKKGEVNIGDVIVADPCWDWGSGKYTVDTNSGQKTFKPEPRQIPMSSELRQKFQRLLRDSSVRGEIRGGWANALPSGDFKLHIGAHATGAAVMADPDLLEQIEAHNRKIIGIEMEAYGVFTAAANSCEPRPSAFVMKSVSDFADPNKVDDFQAYSAYTSARAFKHFLECHL